MKTFLIGDVLDKQLIDVNGRNAGRIDGIVLQTREHAPPRVAYVEAGPVTLLARFSRRLAERYARFDRRFGEGRGAPFRIPWSRVRREGTAYRMDLNADATPINAMDRWLRVKIVDRIPGA